MEKKFFILIIILFTKNIISDNSLTLELNFDKNVPGKITTTFFDKSEFYISFSHSKLISKEASNQYKYY